MTRHLRVVFILTGALVYILYLLQIQGGEFAASTAAYALHIAEFGRVSPPQLPTYNSPFSWQSSEIGEFYFPFPSLVEVVFSKVTGINPRLFALLPFNLVFLLGYWFAAYLATRSAAFSSFFLFIYYLLFQGNYFSQSLIDRADLGTAYFGFFVVLMLVVNRRGFRKEYLVILGILTTATAYTYYRTFFYEVAAIMVFLAVLTVRGRLQRVNPLSGMRWIEAGTVFILFLLGFRVAHAVIFGADVSFSSPYIYVQNVLSNLISGVCADVGLCTSHAFNSYYYRPLPSYMYTATRYLEAAYLPVGLLIAYWAFSWLYGGLKGGSRVVSRGLLRTEVLIALLAISMLITSVLTYAAEEPGDQLISLAPLGGLLLYSLFETRGRSPRRAHLVKAFGYASVCLIILNSGFALAADVIEGWSGTYMGSINQAEPVSHWYAIYSTSQDVAVSDGLSDSFAILWNSNGSVEQYLQGTIPLSDALSTHNLTELTTAFDGRHVNVNLIIKNDLQRPMSGGFPSEVPPLSVGVWYYSLATTDVVYNNGNALAVVMGK